MTLRALDLFCCAGGATRGLQRAGFEVTGMDRDPQPNYVGRFVQGDVFELIESGDVDLDAYDFVWTSPPCQGRTAYKRRPSHVRPVDTDGAIARLRPLLSRARAPWVIENVPGAPLRDPVLLCGSMFVETISVRRHRIFEASFPMPQLACRHDQQTGDFPQATNRANRRKTAEIGVWRIPLETQRAAMGIDWMTREELSEAIPPAYSEWIARQWLASTRQPIIDTDRCPTCEGEGELEICNGCERELEECACDEPPKHDPARYEDCDDCDGTGDANPRGQPIPRPPSPPTNS